MFSTTTMASSTTMPMASTRANRVRVLIEKPVAFITARVPISETGMARMGITAARQVCRKTITTITTSTRASSRVFCTSWIESWMYSVGLKMIRYAKPGGKLAFSLSISARMPLAVSSALAPGCWKMISATAGSSLRKAEVV